ncbi:MAG: inverse autotransporter beta domain-containing protein [Planctomycetota bacterium]|jgi:hypothetical protein
MPSQACQRRYSPDEKRSWNSLVTLAAVLLLVAVAPSVLLSAENQGIPEWATWPVSTETVVTGVSAVAAVAVETPPVETIQSQPAPDWVGDVASADSGASFYDPSNWYGYEDPFRVRGFAGENYSMRDTTGTFEVFKPLINRRWDNGDEKITYFDGRVGLSQNRYFGNFGMGMRTYYDYWNTIVDGNLWYDLDHVGESTFHQITVGIGAQSRYFSIRGHVYEPIRDTIQPTGFTDTTSTPVFSGNVLSFERYRIESTALGGFDLELGFIFPGLAHDTAMYAGLYSFESDNGLVQFDGVSGRVESEVLAGVSAGVQVTYDDHHDMSYLFSLSWKFSSDWGLRSESIRRRLGQFTPRNYNIVMTENRVLDPVIATRPGTGTPIHIVHARSSGSGPGDGSFGSPFTSLSDAVAAASADSNAEIILAHAGGVFDGQAIVVPEDRRFLGDSDSVTHQVETAQFGLIDLPRTSSATAAPVIQNAPGTAIELASGVELNNVNVRDAVGTGVLVSSVTGDVAVQNVSIDGADDGLVVRDLGGSAVVTVRTLNVTNTMGDAISLRNNGSGTTVALAGPTTVDNPLGDGLAITGGEGDVTVASLGITNYQSRAIDIRQSDGDVTFSQPLSIVNATGSLSEAILIQESDGDVSFADVAIVDMNRPAVGAPLVNLLTNTNRIAFEQLDVTSNNGGALAATYSGVLNGTLRIEGGTIATQNAAAVLINNVMDMEIKLDSVSASNTPVGVQLVDAGSAAFNEQFRIIGDGVTAGSGGVMTGVDRGVVVTNSDDVSLNFLQIDSTVAGVEVTDSDGVIVNGLSLTSSSSDWVGVDVTKSFQAQEGQNTLLTNNTITGSGDNQIGIDLDTDRTLPATDLTVDGNSISLTGMNTTGINLLAVGNTLLIGEEGDINLFNNGIDNFVNATNPFVPTEMDAEITGQLLINGTLMP